MFISTGLIHILNKFLAAILCPPIELLHFMGRDTDANTAGTIVTYTCSKPSMYVLPNSVEKSILMSKEPYFDPHLLALE